MSAVAIRDATEDDLAAIRDIYNHYVGTSTCTFQLEPDTAADSERWFRERDPALHPVIVAEQDGAIVGWGALGAFKSRRGYRLTAENSVYVDHQKQGQGIGSALLEVLLERARRSEVHTIVASIDALQSSSVRLHQRHGFQAVGHLREVGRKFDRQLDVVYLQLILASAEAKASSH